MKPKPTLPTTQQPPHEIVIEIDEAGNIEASVLGITGTACSDISKFLDELGDVTEDRHTVDYYGDPKQQTITTRK